MSDSSTEILIGDVREKLLELRTAIKLGEVNRPRCIVTSPPYWGLRDYGTKPQIWGGRGDCEHVWASAGKLHKGGEYGISDYCPGRDRSAANAVRDIAFGDNCELCGAWRGQLGLEPHPRLYVDHIVEIFEIVRDVLADDGTLWLNMGDCYATGAGRSGNTPGGWKQGEKFRGDRRPEANGRGELQVATGFRGTCEGGSGKHHYIPGIGPMVQPNRLPLAGFKPKDLVGQPWRVAFALQDAGWYLRSDIIWAKPNPMPESIRDRPTKSHEYIFLLTKSSRYYYNCDAIKEDVTGKSNPRGKGINRKVSGWNEGDGSHHAIGFAKSPKNEGRTEMGLRDATKFGRGPGWRNKQNASFSAAVKGLVDRRNARTVWTIPTEPYPHAHYATFPTAIPRRCILAGTKPGDTVLDPFGGSGTTAAIANSLGRSAILIDLNPDNEALMRARIARGMIQRKVKKHRKCETKEMIFT